MMILWENKRIESTGNSQTSIRKVPDGWIVTEAMWNMGRSENENYAMTSCFVQDKGHAWEPTYSR